MAKTITQKIVFKNTSSKVLYNMYMNEKKHSELTGGPAKISAKEGAAFSAHGGYIKGKNLHLIKDTLIVQTWRGSDWDKNETDSVFILKFETKGENTVMKMIHANVPSEHVKSIKKGWNEYYWDAWKKDVEENK